MTVKIHTGRVTLNIANNWYQLIAAPLGKAIVVRQITVTNGYNTAAYYSIGIHHKSGGFFNWLVYRHTIQPNETADHNNLFVVLWDGDYLEIATNHPPFWATVTACEDIPYTPDYKRSYIYTYSVNTWTDLVTAHATDQTVVGGVGVYNFMSTSCQFMLSINSQQRIQGLVTVPGYGFWFWRPMLGLDPGDVLRFYCVTNAYLEFSAWYAYFE